MTLPRLLPIAIFLAFICAGSSVRAEGMNIIRDAEIEAMLDTYIAPIQEAAGMAPHSIRFVLVQNSAINAFVAGGSNMFIYTGLLRAAKTPDELIGVMAHEAGHIAGGHLVRSGEEMRNASATAILTTIAGVAAAVASRDGNAGAAAVSLGQQVAQRSYLQYSRTQESSADQAALRFLDQSHMSAAGMRDFLQRLQDQELLPTDQQVEFVRTHPLTRERVESVTAHVDAVTGSKPLPASYTQSFDRMRAKLEGFIDPRNALLHHKADATDFPSRYARAIACHQTGDTRAALALTEGLLKEEPRNPYLYELKGQILYESGQVANAIEPYQKAVELSDGNSLLRIGYAQALLNTNQLAKATTELESASARERDSPQLWRLLATAYGRQNQLGLAAYAQAEEAIARGDKKTARQYAKRAQEILPAGSPGWLKAGDVLTNTAEKD